VGRLVVLVVVGGMGVPVGPRDVSEAVEEEEEMRVLLRPVGAPLGRAVPEEAGSAVVVVVRVTPGACSTKLAHPMRVLLDRCTTKERLPRKEGSEGMRARYESW